MDELFEDCLKRISSYSVHDHEVYHPPDTVFKIYTPKRRLTVVNYHGDLSSLREMMDKYLETGYCQGSAFHVYFENVSEKYEGFVSGEGDVVYGFIQTKVDYKGHIMYPMFLTSSTLRRIAQTLVFPPRTQFVGLEGDDDAYVEQDDSVMLSEVWSPTTTFFFS